MVSHKDCSRRIREACLSGEREWPRERQCCPGPGVAAGGPGAAPHPLQEPDPSSKLDAVTDPGKQSAFSYDRKSTLRSALLAPLLSDPETCTAQTQGPQPCLSGGPGPPGCCRGPALVLQATLRVLQGLRVPSVRRGWGSLKESYRQAHVGIRSLPENPCVFNPGCFP